MTRQKWISMIVVTAILSTALSEWAGATAQAAPRGRSKVVVSPRAGVGHWVGPHARKRVVVPGHRHRFIRLGPPLPCPVIVPRPVVRPIVVNPLPSVTITVPTVHIAPTKLTVWVTNSNGSRISVELTKDGPWYVGPQGEYYTSIPTNEQLRVVYGF